MEDFQNVCNLLPVQDSAPPLPLTYYHTGQLMWGQMWESGKIWRLLLKFMSQWTTVPSNPAKDSFTGSHNLTRCPGGEHLLTLKHTWGATFILKFIPKQTGILQLKPVCGCVCKRPWTSVPATALSSSLCLALGAVSPSHELLQNLPNFSHLLSFSARRSGRDHTDVISANNKSLYQRWCPESQ